MPKNKKPTPEQFIEPMFINGMHGRLLDMPAPTGKKRRILFVYGHHSSLERWWGLVQDLNQYGAVTMPDLPGFGGMNSLYKIGKTPDIDTLADYLAAFIKLHYKRGKVTIIGLSFGFVIATRMLQRYPDLVKKVDLLISVVGFTHYDDFAFSKRRIKMYKIGTWLFSRPVLAWAFRYVLLQPSILRLAYARTHNAKSKFEGLTPDQRKSNMEFEIYLWHANDLRTHMFTSHQFLKLDNCQKPVKLPVWHIGVSADQYFDNAEVEQHLNLIFDKVNVVVAQMDNHAPSILAEMEEAAPIIPPEIRQLLER